MTVIRLVFDTWYGPKFLAHRCLFSFCRKQCYFNNQHGKIMSGWIIWLSKYELLYFVNLFILSLCMF